MNQENKDNSFHLTLYDVVSACLCRLDWYDGIACLYHRSLGSKSYSCIQYLVKNLVPHIFLLPSPGWFIAQFLEEQRASYVDMLLKFVTFLLEQAQHLQWLEAFRRCFHPLTVLIK